MDYYHVDVFSAKALSGNGLTVVFSKENLESADLQKIAEEFKQFETIFLKQTGEKCFRARIFTVEEELYFAGHPILGAAAAIHEKLYAKEDHITITLALNHKSVQTESIKRDGFFQATMNQGQPEFLGVIDGEQKQYFLKALNLTAKDLHPTLPLEVVSTGLPYLLVPLASGLEKAKICVNDLENQLKRIDAKFVYLFDVDKREGRTWDNQGTVEDVATGSAAGPVGAYLYRRHICASTEAITIHQGSFLGRPSTLKVYSEPVTGEIKVSGAVKIVAIGKLLL